MLVPEILVIALHDADSLKLFEWEDYDQSITIGNAWKGEDNENRIVQG